MRAIPVATATLYSAPLSMYGMKVHIAALEKEIPVSVVMVPFTTDHRYEPKHPEVIRINPKRQVPVLVHGAVEIFDSTQIFEYFEHLRPNPPLWPASPEGRAVSRLLELKADEVFFPNVIQLMSLQERLGSEIAQASIGRIHEYYEFADRALKGKAFLCGTYTYADIAFFIAYVFAARMSADLTDDYPHILSWRDRVITRPHVSVVLANLVRELKNLKRPVPAFMAHLGA